MKYFFLTILVLLALLNSCTNIHRKYFNPNTVDTLIWGTYAGMATPDYSLIFKFSKQKLFVDSSDSYYYKEASNDPSKYNWINLPNPDTLKIYQLIRLIPLEFFGKDTIFGIPDNVDQGGTFVIVYQEGKMTKFDIDNFTVNVSKDIATLSIKIREVVNYLSEKYKVK
jgi:hypothetical protein